MHCIIRGSAHAQACLRLYPARAPDVVGVFLFVALVVVQGVEPVDPLADVVAHKAQGGLSLLGHAKGEELPQEGRKGLGRIVRVGAARLFQRGLAGKERLQVLGQGRDRARRRAAAAGAAAARAARRRPCRPRGRPAPFPRRGAGCASAQKSMLAPCIMLSFVPLTGQRRTCICVSSITPSRTSARKARSYRSSARHKGPDLRPSALQIPQ